MGRAIPVQSGGEKRFGYRILTMYKKVSMLQETYIFYLEKDNFEVGFIQNMDIVNLAWVSHLPKVTRTITKQDQNLNSVLYNVDTKSSDPSHYIKLPLEKWKPSF